jgi:hypothetical protein
MPTQQLVINIPEAIILSFKEIFVEGEGTQRTMRKTNTIAMPAKRSESMTSLVGLKSIS